MHLFIVWFLFFLFFSQPFSSFSSDFRFPHGKPKSNKFSPVEVPAAVPGLFLFFFFFLPHSSVFCIITFFLFLVVAFQLSSPSTEAVADGERISGHWFPILFHSPPPFSPFFLSSFPRHLYHHIFLELFGIFFSLWVSLSLFFSLCNHQR